MNLSRKYKPVTLSDYFKHDVVGEKMDIFELDSTRKLNTVLISGLSGNGKTLLGNLLSKFYLCKDKGEHFDVCNICNSCKEFNKAITTGDFADVPNFRALDIFAEGKDLVLSTLLGGDTFKDRKVYFIDDAHMLSNSAQEDLVKLLKLLKNLSGYALFVICTTDANKLSKDLVSICNMKIQVDKLNEEKLFKHLAHICLGENTNFSVDGLTLLSSALDMSVRETINTLEVISGTYKCVNSLLASDALVKHREKSGQLEV